MTKWMSLVKKTKRAHPGWSLGQAMKEAKKHYKKGGGAVEDAMEAAKAVAAPTGGRRRRGRKTRRGGALSPLPLGGKRRSRKMFGLF
jgi:hypothetical protein